MKKKNLLFVAAAMVMAGCASDDMIGDNAATQSDNQVIGFNMNMPAMTRATLDDDKAATKLNNMFIVWGEKNETGTFSDVNTVFKNYVVKYEQAKTNTTISNTNGWEYVGVDHSFFYKTENGKTTENVTSNIGKDVAQTIKYWDDKATKYTFTAVSALEDDIENGYVTISKTTSGDAYSKGYTVTVGASGHPENIFYADRTEVTPDKTSQKYTHDPVKLTFRNFQSKVRFGIYETVPGYKVVITGITYNAGNTKKTNSDKGFGVDGN